MRPMSACGLKPVIRTEIRSMSFGPIGVPFLCSRKRMSA